MPYFVFSKARSKRPKENKSVKHMKPVDTTRPDGEHQFKPSEDKKKMLTKKDIFEIK